MSDTDTIIHNFENKKKKVSPGLIIIVFLLAIFIGIGGGYFFASNNSSTKTLTSQQNITDLPKGTVIGSSDLNTFKDTAQGVMQAGGIDGEGQYHLVRPGGDAQNVYLTSSIIDLSKFIGKKVKVNGQTQTAKKAGWLMDAGRVEVLE